MYETFGEWQNGQVVVSDLSLVTGDMLVAISGEEAYLDLDAAEAMANHVLELVAQARESVTTK